MTPEAIAVPAAPSQTPDEASSGAALQTLEERTRAIADVADGLRPLLALAQQAPAFVAVLMDSIDEAVRTANAKGIDVERGLLNGAEAALRFGATMDAERVRELDALLNSGVLAPGTLRIIGEVGRALTETVETRPRATGLISLLRAFGQPDVQRVLGFIVTFAERFGGRLREWPAVEPDRQRTAP
jgi:uncharacterized protein YjgD (DUF1641 family)